MQITFTECVGMNGGLFRDLADHPWVEDWLKAILNGQTEFKPVDVRICYRNDTFVLIEDGKADDNAFKTLEKVAGYPARLRRIPHQRMYIQLDGFERVLYIDLDHDELA